MKVDEHPARKASLLSREYVQTKNREAWLNLYADEAIIEDPIGISHIDPDGKGHKGKAARETFWDNFIAPADIQIEIKESYAAGNEVANLVELTITIPAEEKKALQQKVFGIFTYAVNDEGKLLSLRGYWETDNPKNSLSEIEL